MKNWIIAQTSEFDTYFIPTEKSIWLSKQPKGVDIQMLIANKNLGIVKSIRYEDLKEIVFIDTDSNIEFKYKNNDSDDEEFTIQTDVYSQIQSYIKSHLKGIELKNYSIYKQALPQLIAITIAAFLSIATYITAIEIENGVTVNVSGKRSIIKAMMISVAENLGSFGTISAGFVIMGILGSLLIRTIKNPKEGEVLTMSKMTKLDV